MAGIVAIFINCQRPMLSLVFKPLIQSKQYARMPLLRSTYLNMSHFSKKGKHFISFVFILDKSSDTTQFMSIKRSSLALSDLQCIVELFRHTSKFSLTTYLRCHAALHAKWRRSLTKINNFNERHSFLFRLTLIYDFDRNHLTKPSHC